eukprot:6208267-Pleurochrysis_carterae.AAC.4
MHIKTCTDTNHTPLRLQHVVERAAIPERDKLVSDRLRISELESALQVSNPASPPTVSHWQYDVALICSTSITWRDLVQEGDGA